MAAGLGYKEFATGDVLTAAAANGYLASQVVMVFADAAARTAAITSPQEGMISYLKDTNATQYYSGSAWVNIAGSSTPTAAAVQCYKGGNQSISNSTTTVVTFDSEFIDTNGFHSTSTNTDRLTVPTGYAGKYLVIATANFAGNSTGIRQLLLYKNTTVVAENVIATNSSGGSTNANAQIIVDLAVGDYVTFSVWQNSGGALNIQGWSGGTYTQFGMTYLGA